MMRELYEQDKPAVCTTAAHFDRSTNTNFMTIFQIIVIFFLHVKVSIVSNRWPLGT